MFTSPPSLPAGCGVRRAECDGSESIPRTPHGEWRGEEGPHFAPGGGGGIEVRPARIADMQQVEPLINEFARQGVMLSKTLEQLVRNFREFVVAVEGEGRILGCGALRVYTGQLAEVGSLAVDGAAHGLGVGRALVERLAAEADLLGIGTIFALTLEDGFFHRLGFRTVPKEMFPLKVWADCRSCPKLHTCDEIAVVKEL